MKVGVVSGYFNQFHEGHKQYLKSASENCDMLYVIINNLNQQKKKYKENAALPSQLSDRITTWCNNNDISSMVVTSIDDDCTVTKSLEKAKKTFPNCEMIKFVDGDRTLDTIPESELNVMKHEYLGNQKVASSSEILRRKING